MSQKIPLFAQSYINLAKAPMPHRQDTHLNTAAPLTCASLSVQRAVFELRCGRIVVVETANGDRAVILAAENVNEANLLALKAFESGPLCIALTQARAKALNLPRSGDSAVLRLTLDAAVDVDTIARFADPLAPAPQAFYQTDGLEATVAQGFEHAAIGLVKIAYLLPTALVLDLSALKIENTQAWAKSHNILTVEAEDVFKSERCAAQTLMRVSEAPVPLEDAEQARVIAYRPQDGGLEHLAIVIGDPQQAEKPALIRIHSQCFTGDLLGSLRCDCGDQLRGAIRAIAKDGGGVLLYLAQEGRGIGLVNKLRAYVLQDQGTDTLEANESLGFDADERVYLPAAFMLNDLGLKKVRLLTNNPAKVRALIKAKIEVIDRVEHAFPSNKHNETYLKTKKDKGGHLL